MYIDYYTQLLYLFRNQMSIVNVFQKAFLPLVVQGFLTHNRLGFFFGFCLKSHTSAPKKVARRGFFHNFPLFANLSRQITVFRLLTTQNRKILQKFTIDFSILDCRKIFFRKHDFLLISLFAVFLQFQANFDILTTWKIYIFRSYGQRLTRKKK